MLVLPLINSFDYVLIAVAIVFIIVTGIVIQKIKHKEQAITTNNTNEDTEYMYKESNFGTPGKIQAVKTYDRKGVYVNTFSEVEKEKAKATTPTPKYTSKLEIVRKDDLKKINGIGPSIEKQFNDFGYYTFKQLTLLKKSDDSAKSKLSSMLPKQVTIDDICNQAKFYYKRQQASA